MAKDTFSPRTLSDFAYDHDPNDIRIAIAKPQEQQVAPHTLARVTNQFRPTISGVIRNESNSSLQIQDTRWAILFIYEIRFAVHGTVRLHLPCLADYQQKVKRNRD